MTVSDEHLSAFLDNELPESEMALIRAALVEDESMADRLAELAMVDELVASAYRPIDAKPLPTAVTDRIRPAPTAKSNVLPFRAAVRSSPLFRRLPAIAAALVVAIGLGVVMLRQFDAPPAWQAVAKVLESSPSGTAVVLANGDTVLPRLTFRDHGGDYCRQFQHRKASTLNEAVACRHNGMWVLVGQREAGSVDGGDLYQTASGPRLLDELIDQLMETPLSSDAESSLLDNAWVVEPGGNHDGNED